MSRPEPTTRFLAFHRQNTTIYHLLVKLIRERRSRRTGNLGHFGIAHVYERLRWDEPVTTTGVPYKLANEHRAYYSRLIEHCEPDLAGMFKTRPSVADEIGRRGRPDHLLLFKDEAARDDGWLDEAAQVVERSMMPLDSGARDRRNLGEPTRWSNTPPPPSEEWLRSRERRRAADDREDR